MNDFMKKTTSLCAMVFLSTFVMANTEFDDPIVLQQELTTHIETPSNQSYVPIIAYDGTYGLILGVAYFRYPNKKSDKPSDQEFDILLYAADGPVISLETRWKKSQIKENIDLQVFTELSNFFINDYPNAQFEGNLIDQQTAKLKTQLTHNLTDTHNLVYEVELEVKEFADDAPQQYKTGTSTIASIGYLIDERDNGNNSKNGYLLQSIINLKPHFLSSVEDATFSSKLELDARLYTTVSDKQSIVSRAYFQLSDGNLLNAKFGGSNLMRGVSGNRFVGKQAFTLQNEYRVQFNKHIGGVGFLSLGQINTQEDLLINYGLGLRVGLPPDQTQQIRIDFGFDTEGHKTFMLQFNQAI
ncbi:MAG: BamA/TamA family outer membrane protein [Saccharospirillaceae bacterium]|nr:outer membrane protein assembly factor [Pseudomonadales bacterium]NRB80736.1 BamA/TamA family outer membrane protein [Saccharospirillaceae bacterium]